MCIVSIHCCQFVASRREKVSISVAIISMHCVWAWGCYYFCVVLWAKRWEIWAGSAARRNDMASCSIHSMFAHFFPAAAAAIRARGQTAHCEPKHPLPLHITIGTRPYSSYFQCCVLRWLAKPLDRCWLGCTASNTHIIDWHQHSGKHFSLRLNAEAHFATGKNDTETRSSLPPSTPSQHSARHASGRERCPDFWLQYKTLSAKKGLNK